MTSIPKPALQNTVGLLPQYRLPQPFRNGKRLARIKQFEHIDIAGLHFFRGLLSMKIKPEIRTYALFLHDMK